MIFLKLDGKFRCIFPFTLTWNDPSTNTLRTATIEQTFNPKTVKDTICNTWGLSEKSY
jgi:hypothetical protein